MENSNLATAEELKEFGSLGWKMGVPEIISQLKVIHDEALVGRDMNEGIDYVRMDLFADAIKNSILALEFSIKIDNGL